MKIITVFCLVYVLFAHYESTFGMLSKIRFRIDQYFRPCHTPSLLNQPLHTIVFETADTELHGSISTLKIMASRNEKAIKELQQRIHDFGPHENLESLLLLKQDIQKLNEQKNIISNYLENGKILDASRMWLLERELIMKYDEIYKHNYKYLMKIQKKE